LICSSISEVVKIAGVNEEVAREALRLASHKLPVKTKFVKREELEVCDLLNVMLHAQLLRLRLRFQIKFYLVLLLQSKLSL
jgi:hypothetical protein